MIIIDNTVISDDLLEVLFCCDLPQCNGACCIEGDAGAPLTTDEIKIIGNSLELIKPYMESKGKEVVDSDGVFTTDTEGKQVTPLINGGECAFVLWEKGIACCAIEKAHFAGMIEFQKPISCHLYPVRLLEYDDFTAVNVHRWHICADAFQKGKKEGIPLHRFLKTALVRRFGIEWFNDLEKEYDLKNKVR
jgi:hypothetical protein